MYFHPLELNKNFLRVYIVWMERETRVKINGRGLSPCGTIDMPLQALRRTTDSPGSSGKGWRYLPVPKGRSHLIKYRGGGPWSYTFLTGTLCCPLWPHQQQLLLLLLLAIFGYRVSTLPTRFT